MEINKAKQKKKLQKKIIPFAMAAVLTVQGTSVPAYGSVTVNKEVKPAYQVTKKTVVANVDAKKLTLEENKKIKITAAGYTIAGGELQAHTGAYVLTTNGNPVADANIEIENGANADITLENCYLTSAKNIDGTNKGLFSFSGGKVNLKLEGTNSVTYTGNEDKYKIGSKSANEDLTISGGGKLYLKNVGIEADSITISDGKIYSDKKISVGSNKKLSLTGNSVLAVDDLNLGGGDTLSLDGDVVVYFKTPDNPTFTSEYKKGVVYIGTTVTVDSDKSVKLKDGFGIICGNPNIPDLTKPDKSQLLTEVVDEDVIVKDVEFTGKEVEPEVTVKVNRYILGGEKVLKKDEDYEVKVLGNDKINAGDKNVEIEFKSAKGYRGKIKKPFKVTPKNIVNAEVLATLTPWDYNGNEREITVDAVTLGGIKLNVGKDYNVTGNKATNAGEYTLKIEGAGNYGGKIERKWKINKATLAISEAAIAPKTYDGKTDATVTVVTLEGVKANTLTKDTDYDVTGIFSDKNAGTNKTVTVKVTLKDTEMAKNYELIKDTLMLTGQEIKKGKFEKPRIAGTCYLDDDKPDEKFKYVVSKDETGYSSEYQMDGTAEDKWQDSNVFKGIAPDSKHIFYMRRKATENMEASDSAQSNEITFNKIDNPNKPALQFKVTDSATSGKKKITIVTTAGVEYKIGNDTDYSDNGIKDNIDNNTSVDIKARFKATKTRKPSLDTEQTVNVSKNTYVGPAPTLEEGTYYVDPTDKNKFEYKVKTVKTAPAGKTYEYSKDLVKWITPAAINGTVTFGAITPGATVNFYARIKEDAKNGAGIQGSRTVTFNKLKRNELPTLNVEVGGAKGDKTVTIVAIELARYKFGDGNWQDERVKEHITDEKITVGIYIKETVTHEASKPVFKEIILNEKENTGGGTTPAVPLPSTEDKKPEAGRDEKKPDINQNNKKPDTTKDVTIADKTKPVAKVTAESVSKNKAEADVSSDDIKEALEAARESEKNIVKLKVTAPKGTKSVDVKLEKGILSSLIESAIKAFEVTAAKVKVQLENKAISLIDKKGEGDINLSIASVTKLSARERKIAGKRPVYKISLKSGETKITNLGEGKAKISLPYNKPAKEKATGLYVAYFNKKGKTVRIKASYNDKKKTLTFSTKYLTKYAVGYKAPKKSK